MADVKPRRAYRSRLREKAALLGQKAVIDAAAALFVEQGYARTTIDQVAARAGVSRPTVFAVGSKAQLLALARRAAVGGDAVLGNEPALAEILAERDPAELLRRFAGLASGIAQRWAPLAAVLEEAAASDPALVPLRDASRDEIHGCARQVIAALRASGWLRGDMSPKAAADVLWLLIEPGQYRRLVTERGWSHRAFTRWQATAMIRLLLP
ncbi:MAG TPA: helix-turn-helix domain-containing protein [Streptosporangiaceae bacterium]|jgi:AcrR family transcriptional regulator|nr:helix-turn-helix domain-containing protein [Streptosporangiaceae bacterium]